MASHEFRTPLTAVLNSAILTEKYTTTEQQAQRERHLARIRTSVKHLTDILEEFLSVGKLEAGRQVMQPMRVILPDLLQEAIVEVQGLRQPGQHIALELSSPAPLQLDGSLLRKILVNLLSNALKYSGDTTTVWVRATAHHRQLTLSVQDEGIGISPEDQAHLFERFYRASNAVTIAGTGLGLYIVTKYLELMGGQLVLHSELQVGTTFTLTLPYEDHPAN
jgi:signal transduction histidine kinase